MLNVANQINPNQGSEYYAAMDGFRGLLAIVVAVYHTIWMSHLQSWRFIENGAVIIDLFFALSGFLMWRLYAAKLRTTADGKEFVKRRFARLYPLHLFMLAIAFAYAVARVFAHKIGIAEITVGETLPFQPGSSENWFGFFQNLTMTNAMGLSDGLNFNVPSWTVGAEFWAYMSFAAMMIWFKPKGIFDYSLIAGGIFFIYALLFFAKPDMNITHDFGLWRCIAGFYTGVLAAISFPRIRQKIRRLSSIPATLLETYVLIFAIGFVVFPTGKMQFFVAPVLFLFLVVFACDKGAISKFMSQSIFQYLAKISYSVYLVHFIIAVIFASFFQKVLGFLPSGWSGDMWLFVYIGVVIFVSDCTYHFVERPGGKLIRNWNRSQKRVAEVASSV